VKSLPPIQPKTSADKKLRETPGLGDSTRVTQWLIAARFFGEYASLRGLKKTKWQLLTEKYSGRDRGRKEGEEVDLVVVCKSGDVSGTCSPIGYVQERGTGK
jgi:hypothetical protein